MTKNGIPLPPSPRAKDMYGSPEGSTHNPKIASPRAKVSPRIKMLKRWPRIDERRVLHVVYCVGNIEESIKYYQECLEMHILRKIDFPEDKYLTVFMGYGTEDNHLVVELTYNYGVTKYEIGTGLNHFGITVPNVQKALDVIKKKGFPAPETCMLTSRIGMGTLSDSSKGQAFGMHLLSRNDYPLSQRTFAYLAYDLDNYKTSVTELEYHYNITKYTKGISYDHVQNQPKMD